MDASELVAGEGAYVLRYEGNGRFGLQNLTVRWTGPSTALADVVSVLSGEVEFVACRFTGATTVGEQWGAGLELKAQAQGTVADCVIEHNPNGISIGGQAAPVVSRTKCSGNDLAGILISDYAQPTLKDNTISNNGEIGIKYLGRASGVASRNISTANAIGIVVNDDANPTLDSNSCRANSLDGLTYMGNASGHARANTCQDNEQCGIQVLGSAQPQLYAQDDGDRVCSVCQGVRELRERKGELSEGEVRKLREQGLSGWKVYLEAAEERVRRARAETESALRNAGDSKADSSAARPAEGAGRGTGSYEICEVTVQTVGYSLAGLGREQYIYEAKVTSPRGFYTAYKTEPFKVTWGTANLSGRSWSYDENVRRNLDSLVNMIVRDGWQPYGSVVSEQGSLMLPKFIRALQ